MNNAHNTLLARSGAQLNAVALVRRLAAGCALAGVLVMGVASVAQASSNDKDRDRDRDAQRAQPVQSAPRERERERVAPPQPPVRDTRQFDTRAADEQRRQAQAQQDRSADSRRSGRLTPDERRDLRRQINEAGLDIYPNTPRR